MASPKRLFVDERPHLVTPYLDTSVFLAHIKEEALLASDGRTRFDITTHIMEDAKAGKYTIYTSTITLAEVRRLRERGTELAPDERIKINDFFKDFLEHEWIQLIEVNREIGEKAQDIGARTGIFPMDALHLATAMSEPCNVLLLWDKPSFLDKLPENPFEDVRVTEPYWEGTVPMGSTHT